MSFKFGREKIKVTYEELSSSPNGLSSDEAAKRLWKVGPNELVQARKYLRAWELFKTAVNPLVLILLVAASATFFLRQVVDAIIIFIMVLLGSGLNVWQTFRSRKAAEKLKETIAPIVTVFRDGKEMEIERRLLVPGDVISLSAGDLIPADARLLESDDLHVQEAALTGESFPIEKNVSSTGPQGAEANLIFLGTSVVSGSARAIVLATGENTKFGEIVERLSESPEETEFERGMRSFGTLILQTVFFLVLFVLLANIMTGRDPFQSLLFSVALAVGLTPEFLPMITTVTLAQGAVKMAKNKVIVRHLSAMQNLGSIDVLCCDKTGTLTAGTVSVVDSVDPLGNSSEEPMKMAHLNSSFESGIKSPFDTAIVSHVKKEIRGVEKTDEIPFDFERRRLSVILKMEGKYLMITKGAPESILSICSTYEVGGNVQKIDDDSKKRFQQVIQGMGSKGQRGLAIAYKKVSAPAGFKSENENEMILIGFLAFSDLLLPDVKTSLMKLKKDGIQVKILTGDDESVTRHICHEVGIEVGSIITGKEVEELDEWKLGKVAEDNTVFVRVSPSQKHRIILALKSRKHVVGFLGDGINDAPSLHGADVGISVAGAVDVAREAADIILLERKLDVLHSGIIEGRKSFGNVLKYLLMGTSSNFGNMFSMAGAAIFLPFLPMLPVQILLNNFLYDLAQITIPTDHIDPTLLKAPRRWNVKLIRKFMLFIGPVSSLFDFITFYVLLKIFKFSEASFQTGWFIESLATQTLVLFVIRTAGPPWSNRPSGPLAITTLAVVIFGTILPFLSIGKVFGLTAMPFSYLAFLLIIVGCYLVIVYFVKEMLMRKAFVHVLDDPPTSSARSS